MKASERWADIIKLFRAHGWEITNEDERGRGVYLSHPGRMLGLWLDDAFAELFDARYQQGFRDGFERGAYEEQQQEDVEPGDRDALHTIEPLKNKMLDETELLEADLRLLGRVV